MNHSDELIEKIEALPKQYQIISEKLLGYIELKQYSRTQMQNLIKGDIKELILEENTDDFK